MEGATDSNNLETLQGAPPTDDIDWVSDLLNNHLFLADRVGKHELIWSMGEGNRFHFEDVSESTIRC